MSSNIFGNRFAERNQNAWHGLGVRLEGHDTTATEGLKVAKLDYGVLTRTLWYHSPTDGHLVPTDYVAIVRPEWDFEAEAMLGQATQSYMPLQNGELARLLDPLTREWPLETVGALGKGETIFMTLDAGSATVGGDEIKQWLFAYNSHDGNSAFKINITPVRVVCANTCVTGLAEATITADVFHTRRILEEATFAVDLVARLQKAREDAILGLDQLTKIRVSGQQIREVLAAVYPERDAPARLRQLEAQEAGEIELPDDRIAQLTGLRIDTEKARRRALDLQLAAVDRLEAFNGERSKFANTAWAVYNAVTETECWRDGGTQAQLAKSVVMGERAGRMATAYRSLVALS